MWEPLIPIRFEESTTGTRIVLRCILNPEISARFRVPPVDSQYGSRDEMQRAFKKTNMGLPALPQFPYVGHATDNDLRLLGFFFIRAEKASVARASETPQSGKAVILNDSSDANAIEGHGANVDKQRREREEVRALSKYLNMVWPEPKPWRGRVKQWLRNQ